VSVGPVATLEATGYKGSLVHADILRPGGPYPTLSRLFYIGLMHKGENERSDAVS
jgi:hypothetical protein